MREFGRVVEVDILEVKESVVAEDITDMVDGTREAEGGGPMAFARAPRFAMDFDLAGDIDAMAVTGLPGCA